MIEEAVPLEHRVAEGDVDGKGAEPNDASFARRRLRKVLDRAWNLQLAFGAVFALAAAVPSALQAGLDTPGSPVDPVLVLLAGMASGLLVGCLIITHVRSKVDL